MFGSAKLFKQVFGLLTRLFTTKQTKSLQNCTFKYRKVAIDSNG